MSQDRAEDEMESFTYLTSNTMATISSTLALAANVTSFDCTELWTLDNTGKYYCPYVYATGQLQTRCPNLLTGHHPRDKIDHVLSPKLCELAKESPKRFHWRVFPTADRPSNAYQGVQFPVLTEMAYYVESTNDAHIFIVGLATENLQFRPSTFKFLQGLGYAIYVSAFVMDREALGTGTSDADVELDHKEFVPKSTIITPYISAVNLAVLGGGGGSSLDLVSIRRNMSDANLRTRSRSGSLATIRERSYSAANAVTASHIHSHASTTIDAADDMEVGMVLTDSPPIVSSRKSLTLAKDSSTALLSHLNPTALTSAIPEASTEQENSSEGEGEGEEPQDRGIPEETDADQARFEQEFWRLRHDTTGTIISRNRAPTWDPTYPFSYPVGDIPPDQTIPDELTFDAFTHMVHLTDGSNANIYTASYQGEKVVIKVIKEGMETDPIALHEFDLEYGMLSRLRHKHIIRILGAGYEPRRFMVLEYLSKGTLHDLLEQTESKRGLANMMFRKPTFTYIQLLQRAKDMAEALDYMHFRCHPGATIIHRDLKPDNVGFAADGTLKLFDFGLVTCVKTRESPTEAYNMTGYTGSLRYMAPEVALREPYTEKVDVYSFGIMLWQMARDGLPFAGLGKTAFMQEVVRGGQRPKLDRSWPEAFCSLLKRCWAREPEKRPCFAEVIADLGSLMDMTAQQRGSPVVRNGVNLIRGISMDKPLTGWF